MWYDRFSRRPNSSSAFASPARRTSPYEGLLTFAFATFQHLPALNKSSMAPSIASSLSVATILSSAALLAEAHQIVLLPAPTYTTDDKDTKYAPLAFLEDQGFATQEDFTAWRKDNGYDSLRAFNDGASYTVSDGADFTCGFTNINGDAQAIPDGNAMRSTGYTHDGPCEVWLDDTMVMQYDNCHETISGKDYTIDYSSCTSPCTLYWFWLGVRYLKNEYSWQIYKACVPLSASGRRLEGAANESAVLNF